MSMKKSLFAVLVAGVVAASAMPMASAAGQWNFRHREAREQHRIHEGVKSGELTRGEAHRLEHKERKINRMDRRFRKNGLSSRERNKLRRAENHESRYIFRQKHDRQDRG